MAKLPTKLRTRLTIWYMGVLSVLLIVYATIVFFFQYAALTRQIFHDEVRDVVTVEGLLYFDNQGALQLRQDYFSRPNSHLLVDRLMEVRSLDGQILYRTSTLQGRSLGGPNRATEGESNFDERRVKLADSERVMLISHLHSIRGQTLLIRLAYSLAPLDSAMLHFFGLLLAAIAVALGLAGIAGRWIAGRALEPLEVMATRAQNITAHNLHERLQLENSNDELGHLGGVINLLLQRLEEAFAQLQRFTADAAHELRTPLASIRTMAEVTLQRAGETEDFRSSLANILDEITRLNSTIESLLLLSRAETAQPGDANEEFIAGQLLHEVLDLLYVVFEDKSIILETNLRTAQSVMLVGDRALLRIAFVNVLHNALKFSPAGSVMRVKAMQTANTPSSLTIVIEDQGPGIAPGERELVFERFFTSASRTTTGASGTGLGLSITKLIVERSGGMIRFDDSLAGARCVIELPVADILQQEP